MSIISGSGIPAIHVIHENGEWTKPLFEALDALDAPYVNWDMSDGMINMASAAPQGVFYNRMSASSHTRGHLYAPEMTAGLLAWLEGQGRLVLNGRNALTLELSKLVQYAALRRAGLNVPHTIAVSSVDDMLDAYQALPFDDVITKHNRAGKGLGVQLLKSSDAVLAHINSDDFEPSVDGISLMQQYIAPRDGFITRVEFIGQKFMYAVNVDTSNGFELCPADVCELDRGFCPTDAAPRFAFEIDEGFADSAFGQEAIPKMLAVMEAEHLDVAAFEFVTGADGNSYFYDINTNTNYNSEAEARAGVSAMESLAVCLKTALLKSTDVSLREAG